jgi:dsRNA-specific ribonuclease
VSDNDIIGAEYRTRILDHRKDGTPNWQAAATLHGFHGYGRGTSEREAREAAAKDLLRKLHGGLTER